MTWRPSTEAAAVCSSHSPAGTLSTSSTMPTCNKTKGLKRSRHGVSLSKNQGFRGGQLERSSTLPTRTTRLQPPGPLAAQDSHGGDRVDPGLQNEWVKADRVVRAGRMWAQLMHAYMAGAVHGRAAALGSAGNARCGHEPAHITHLRRGIVADAVGHSRQAALAHNHVMLPRAGAACSQPGGQAWRGGGW